MLQYVDICPGGDDETSGRELRHRHRNFAGGDEDKLRGWTFYIGDVAEDLGLDAFKGWAPMQFHSLMESVRAPGWRLWGLTGCAGRVLPPWSLQLYRLTDALYRPALPP